MAMFIGKDIMVAAFPSRHPFYRLMGPWEMSPGQPEGWPEAATAPPLIMANLRERHYEPLRYSPPTSGGGACKGCGEAARSLSEHLDQSTKPCELFYSRNAQKVSQTSAPTPTRQRTPPSPAQAAKRQDVKATPTRQQAGSTTAPPAQPKGRTGKTWLKS